MKKIIVFVLSIGILIACKNNSSVKDAYQRDKKTPDTHSKDDYSSNANTQKADTSKTIYEGDNTDKNEPGDNVEKENIDVPPNKTGADISDWPQSEKTGFLLSCEKQAVAGGITQTVAHRYCDCMLGKLQSKYPDIKVASQLKMDEVKKFTMQYKDQCLGRP